MAIAGKGKGAGAPEGNTNALKHGFYAAALLPGEEGIFEEAKTLSIDHEIALLRTMVLRAARFEAEGGTLTDSVQVVVNTRIGRLRDFMLCKSIIERNARESGALEEDDGWMERFKGTGAHRATFKGNGRSNGRAKNGQGS